MSLLLKLTQKMDNETDAFESVHNYFERPVHNELIENYQVLVEDHEVMIDIQCYALSMLPAKYIRHNVDMSFFLSSTQEIVLVNMIKFAVFLSYLKIKATEENLFYLVEYCYFPVIVSDEHKNILFVNTALKNSFLTWDDSISNIDFIIDDACFHQSYNAVTAKPFVDLKVSDYAIANKMVKVKMIKYHFNSVSMNLFPDKKIFVTLFLPTI